MLKISEFTFLFFLCTLLIPFTSNGKDVLGLRKTSVQEMEIGESVEVTIEISNGTDTDILGLLVGDQVPEGFEIVDQSLSIDRKPLTGTLYEVDEPGVVYQDRRPVRWCLDFPPRFARKNILSPESVLRIMYRVRAREPGHYRFGPFWWAGYSQMRNGQTPIFGTETAVETLVVRSVIKGVDEVRVVLIEADSAQSARLRFTGLTPGTRLLVSDGRGRVVWEVDHVETDSLEWDLQGSDEEAIGSGFYWYHILSRTGCTSGKVIVLP